MGNEIIVKTYPAPPINMQEIRRYSGIPKNDDGCDELIMGCLSETEGVFSYKVCYGILDIEVFEDFVDFGAFGVRSKDLAKSLYGAKKAVVFGATVGFNIDRLIHKYSLISPAKSVIFQGIGAERCESLCNEFNKEINREFKNTTPRFSPGYGDFPLEHQRDIFKVLELIKNMGMALGENLLMSPSKSVTAVIGIK